MVDRASPRARRPNAVKAVAGSSLLPVALPQKLTGGPA